MKLIELSQALEHWHQTKSVAEANEICEQLYQDLGKIGDKVVKILDKERTGRIIGISKDGRTVAVKTRRRAFVVHPSFEEIVVIKEKK